MTFHVLDVFEDGGYEAQLHAKPISLQDGHRGAKL